MTHGPAPVGAGLAREALAPVVAGSANDLPTVMASPPNDLTSVIKSPAGARESTPPPGSPRALASRDDGQDSNTATNESRRTHPC